MINLQEIQSIEQTSLLQSRSATLVTGQRLRLLSVVIETVILYSDTITCFTSIPHQRSPTVSEIDGGGTLD